MRTFRVGDTVTVTERQEAYYSGYAGNPVCFLEPGDVGGIGAVKVPKVHWTPGGHYFCCIDFTKHGRTWRAGVNYGAIRRLKRAG